MVVFVPTVIDPPATLSDVPLNESALPLLPGAQAAPVIVPAPRVPESPFAFVPVPSSKDQYACRPRLFAGRASVAASADDGMALHSSTSVNKNKGRENFILKECPRGEDGLQ